MARVERSIRGVPPRVQQSDGDSPAVHSIGPVTIDAGTGAPAVARRTAVAALEQLGVEQLRDTVTLLVSEIVTNSVLHASCDHITLTISRTGNRVRIETVDCDGATTPRMTEAVRETPGGFGLHIVDRVAREWGVSPHIEGKAVWFELAAPA